MGKAKKTRKFAEMKRVLNPKQVKCDALHSFLQGYKPLNRLCAAQCGPVQACALRSRSLDRVCAAAFAHLNITAHKSHKFIITPPQVCCRPAGVAKKTKAEETVRHVYAPAPVAIAYLSLRCATAHCLTSSWWYAASAHAAHGSDSLPTTLYTV